MRFKKLILIPLISLLGLGILLFGLYYLKTESSKLTFYTETGTYDYFLPDYSIVYFSNKEGQTYIRVSDVFVQTWSLRRFFIDHWWSGGIDIWLKVENGQMNEVITRLSPGADANEDFVLFGSNKISGLVSTEKLTGVTFSSENDEEKIFVHFSSLDLSKGKLDMDLERQYDLLTSDYFNLENPYLDAIQKILAAQEGYLINDELIWSTKDYPEYPGIIVYTGQNNEYIFLVTSDKVFTISDAAKEIAPSASSLPEVTSDTVSAYLNAEATGQPDLRK